MKLQTFLKLFLILIINIYASTIYSQSAGINNTGVVPNPSALLDIDAAPNNNKGLLIPRIPLTATANNAPIGGGIANSLLVFNTATINDVYPGYYYWDGAKWVRLVDDAWQTLGNTGTNPATNFLGTIDNQDLVIKTNNTERVRILSTGEIGVNTPTPVLSLQVNATDALGMPTGTTAQQPPAAPTGATRFNTTAGMLEVFTGTCWMFVNTPPIGATYIQWANAADPNTLYPCTQWIATDIQNGEFIRAVGGYANVAQAGALTGVTQYDAVQYHTHAATVTIDNSAASTTSFDGTHSHGGQTGGVSTFDASIWIPFDDNLTSSGLDAPYNNPTPTTCGNIWNGLATVGNFMGQMNSACFTHTHTINPDGNHSHTIPVHNHTGTVNVSFVNSGNSAPETRPTNVAVKFWRRIN